MKQSPGPRKHRSEHPSFYWYVSCIQFYLIANTKLELPCDFLSKCHLALTPRSYCGVTTPAAGEVSGSSNA